MFETNGYGFCMPLIPKVSREVIHGNSEDILPTLKDNTFDVVVTDPPYPEAVRPYGIWTEDEWFSMMRKIVPHCMRVLKPKGSAVFILQPNYNKLGSMRLWLWKFLLWVGEEYNLVQDVYWWNYTAIPTSGCNRETGLLRPSIKYCIWIGPPDCYRCQDRVLWTPSKHTIAERAGNRILNYQPSGMSVRQARCCNASLIRGGVTPFNLLPICNTDSVNSSGSEDHGAGTPLELCEWWTRYLCPEEGSMLDPFCGAGTVGIAAANYGHSFLGIERIPEYVDISRRKIIEGVRVPKIFKKKSTISQIKRSIAKRVSKNKKNNSNTNNDRG